MIENSKTYIKEQCQKELAQLESFKKSEFNKREKKISQHLPKVGKTRESEEDNPMNIKSLLKIPFCRKGREESLKLAIVFLNFPRISGFFWLEMDML